MMKLKVKNQLSGKKTIGIVAPINSAVWEEGYQLPPVFQKEVMTCFFCKTEQRESLQTESEWYCLLDTKTQKKIYICPACGATKEHIQQVIDYLLAVPNRMVLFQGESAREFPLNIEELKKILGKP